ncbi:MAG: carbamoyl-phosphate synthase large subunit [Candidatus Bathyarchaeia archaeon]
MPKRTDIHKILIIGSGPIIIGQACEFDYSGSQACKALREEGYEVLLVNSNPATIMTDPEMADRVYIEPLTVDVLTEIIKRERPDALLTTMGGQTGLNLAAELSEKGVLDKYGVELIGAKFEAIQKGEDRILFKETMEKAGIPVPKSAPAYSVEEALKIVEEIGYPAIIRAAFTLGGTGGGIAYNKEELKQIVSRGLAYSRIGQVLIEESVIGWKEYELEVMRDLKDNVVIICSIENMDPMGIHTGDSITVAPAQTLTDKEYQILRDAAIKIIRAIGVETGGSNIQFAVHPENGRFVAIEINPRVSRSSALASKATGFPIAKIAAKLAVGLTLDEIPNDITKKTPASFEPTIDYVVVKVPRWPFDKFPDADKTLTTQMKSVGEVMAIGRTFEEALQKAIRSLEIGRYGLGADGKDEPMPDVKTLRDYLKIPTHKRVFYLRQAIQSGMSIDEIYELTKIDKWFLYKIKNIVDMERELAKYTVKTIPKELLRKAKRLGFSDKQIAYLLGTDELTVRKYRKEMGIIPTYKMVDTCAAEFEAVTPYYYSCYEDEDEIKETGKKKVVILGSGPNRIGQGIEFDYCCVHAVKALREEGYEAIMVNCNPETVSTDFDVSDKLYFEPLTLEDVLNIVEREKPEGVIVQLGGQTPINLTIPLHNQGVKILGTSPDDIDKAEDRKRFAEILDKLGIPQPPNGTAMSVEEAKEEAKKLGYPVLIRPSYVLGGRAMDIVYDEETLVKYMREAIEVSLEHPVLIDKFLEDAIETEIDAVSDGEETYIGGVMEHIEEAGVHSGDAACVLPPHSISESVIETMKEYTRKLAKELSVVGLINVQFAVKNGKVYVFEVNPRASRTVPFVSKATGVPLAKIAAKLMVGHKLKEFGLGGGDAKLDHIAVKEAVFPFAKLPGVDVVLGPEMKSTGEVMGLNHDFGMAYYKAELAAETNLPTSGNVFISVRDEEKMRIVPVAKKLQELGLKILATRGTAETLIGMGVETEIIPKISEGRPNVVDYIKSGKISLIINVPKGKGSKDDEFQIRRAAVEYKVPYITTTAAAQATAKAIERIKESKFTIKSLQEYHNKIFEKAYPPLISETSHQT